MRRYYLGNCRPTGTIAPSHLRRCDRELRRPELLILNACRSCGGGYPGISVSLQTCRGPFSAVSTPMFTTKHSFCIRHFRVLPVLMRCAFLPMSSYRNIFSFRTAGEATPLALFPWFSLSTVSLSLPPSETKVNKFKNLTNVKNTKRF